MNWDGKDRRNGNGEIKKLLIICTEMNTRLAISINNQDKHEIEDKAQFKTITEKIDKMNIKAISVGSAVGGGFAVFIFFIKWIFKI